MLVVVQAWMNSAATINKTCLCINCTTHALPYILALFSLIAAKLQIFFLWGLVTIYKSLPQHLKVIFTKNDWANLLRSCQFWYWVCYYYCGMASQTLFSFLLPRQVANTWLYDAEYRSYHQHFHFRSHCQKIWAGHFCSMFINGCNQQCLVIQQTMRQ